VKAHEAPGAGLAFAVFLLEIAMLVTLAVRSALSRGESREAAGTDSSEPFPDEELAHVVHPEILYDRAFEISRDLNAEIQGVENGLLAMLAR
jgi:hypothetical protein